MDLTVLDDLPARLDDGQLAKVEHIASLPVPAMVPVSEQHFLRCMRTLTVLPSRAEDELTAELRLALYRKHFEQWPDEAWSYLTEQATLNCKWFPTPIECRTIFDAWSRADGPWRAHQLAQSRVTRERQARFDDAMAQLQRGEMTQGQVDELPDQWKRIAEVRGYLRLIDRAFVLRPMRGESEQGRSPVSHESNTPGEGEKAPRPHERTGQ